MQIGAIHYECARRPHRRQWRQGRRRSNWRRHNITQCSSICSQKCSNTHPSPRWKLHAATFVHPSIITLHICVFPLIYAFSYQNPFINFIGFRSTDSAKLLRVFLSFLYLFRRNLVFIFFFFNISLDLDNFFFQQ